MQDILNSGDMSEYLQTVDFNTMDDQAMNAIAMQLNGLEPASQSSEASASLLEQISSFLNFSDIALMGADTTSLTIILTGLVALCLGYVFTQTQKKETFTQF